MVALLSHTFLGNHGYERTMSNTHQPSSSDDSSISSGSNGSSFSSYCSISSSRSSCSSNRSGSKGSGSIISSRRQSAGASGGMSEATPSCQRTCRPCLDAWCRSCPVAARGHSLPGSPQVEGHTEGQRLQLERGCA